MVERRRRLAVVAGTREQFECWAKQNPHKAGERLRFGCYADAFRVSDHWDLAGTAISGVEYYGTYYQLAGIDEIERAAKVAVSRG